MDVNSKRFYHCNFHRKIGNPCLICVRVSLLILLGQIKTLQVELCFSVWRNIFIWLLYIFSGAVASMFWIDDELGVDIYLDGKFKEEICFVFK